MKRFIVILFLHFIIITSIQISNSNSVIEKTHSAFNPWALTMINANQAHTITKGENSIIALLDTGVEENIFANFLWINSDEIPNNNIDDDNNGYIDDIHGWNFYSNNNDTNDWSTISHGSSVASIIQEIAPESKLMILKVINSNNIIPDNDLDELDNALHYAKNNNANVVYMPFRISTTPTYLIESFSELYMNNLTLVSSAGQNSRGSLGYIYSPARDQHVIAVGAVDKNKVVYDIGNYGNELEITSPGVNLYSKNKFGANILVSGTSFSGAYVTGVISLMYSQNSDLSPDIIRNLLYSTSTDINTSGSDIYSGSGIIHGYHSTKYANDREPPILIAEKMTTLFDTNKLNISLSFFENSGLISCYYRYRTNSSIWSDVLTYLDDYEKIYSDEDNHISLDFVITNPSSILDIEMNLTDFTGRMTKYKKDSIYTGLKDNVSQLSSLIISSTDYNYTTIPSESSTRDHPYIITNFEYSDNSPVTSNLSLPSHFISLNLSLIIIIKIKGRKKINC